LLDAEAELMRAAAAFGTAGWIAGDDEWYRRAGSPSPRR
jgi:hypothetical protein